jgi:hypothetical protein
MNKRSIVRDNGKVFLNLALACALSASIVGCGGGSGSNNDSTETDNNTEQPLTGPSKDVPADGTITLIDSGNEPLETLTAQQSSVIKSTLQARAQQILETGDKLETTEVTADFDVRTTLTKAATEVQVAMIPVLKNYSAETIEGTELLPGSWNRIYSLQGELINANTNDRDGLIAYNTQFLFAFPGLMLAVPDAAIGEGSHWAYAQEVASGIIQTEIQLQDISSDLLTVSMTTFYLPTDKTTDVAYSNTLEASYDKKSLLIREGESTLEMGQSYSVTINGQATEYKSTDRFVHIITRAAQ